MPLGSSYVPSGIHSLTEDEILAKIDNQIEINRKILNSKVIEINAIDVVINELAGLKTQLKAQKPTNTVFQAYKKNLKEKLSALIDYANLLQEEVKALESNHTLNEAAKSNFEKKEDKKADKRENAVDVVNAVDFVNELPLEKTVEIAEYLKAPDIARASQVSKTWKDVFYNAFIYDRLVFLSKAQGVLLKMPSFFNAKLPTLGQYNTARQTALKSHFFQNDKKLLKNTPQCLEQIMVQENSSGKNALQAETPFVCHKNKLLKLINDRREELQQQIRSDSDPTVNRERKLIKVQGLNLWYSKVSTDYQFTDDKLTKPIQGLINEVVSADPKFANELFAGHFTALLFSNQTKRMANEMILVEEKFLNNGIAKAVKEKKPVNPFPAGFIKH